MYHEKRILRCKRCQEKYQEDRQKDGIISANYTEKNGNPDNYDLMINTAAIGINGAETIKTIQDRLQIWHHS